MAYGEAVSSAASDTFKWRHSSVGDMV